MFSVLPLLLAEQRMMKRGVIYSFKVDNKFQTEIEGVGTNDNIESIFMDELLI